MNFGFRTYNPTIGLFDGADLLGDLNEMVSPAAYTNNSYINAIDIDGLYTETGGGQAGNDDDPSKRLIITQNPGSMANVPNHSNASIAMSEGNYASLRAEREIRADATGVSRSSTPFVPRPNVAVWPPVPLPQLREDTRFKEGTQYFEHERAGQFGYNMGSIASLASIKNILKVPKFYKAIEIGGSRAFFSGKGTEAKAIQKGFQTLGQTIAGQNLQNLIRNKNIPWSQAEPMW